MTFWLMLIKGSSLQLESAANHSPNHVPERFGKKNRKTRSSTNMGTTACGRPAPGWQTCTRRRHTRAGRKVSAMGELSFRKSAAVVHHHAAALSEAFS